MELLTEFRRRVTYPSTMISQLLTSAATYSNMPADENEWLNRLTRSIWINAVVNSLFQGNHSVTCIALYQTGNSNRRLIGFLMRCSSKAANQCRNWQCLLTNRDYRGIHGPRALVNQRFCKPLTCK